MTEKRKPFDLLAHLHKKSRGKERVVIPLDLYDQVLPLITSALYDSLISPENDAGVTALVIFGSWARRDEITGPKKTSDLELMAYKAGYLDGDEQNKIEDIVRKNIAKKHLGKLGIHLHEIMVWSGLHNNDLINIQQGHEMMTKHGYVIVTK